MRQKAYNVSTSISESTMEFPINGLTEIQLGNNVDEQAPESTFRGSLSKGIPPCNSSIAYTIAPGPFRNRRSKSEKSTRREDGSVMAEKVNSIQDLASHLL